MRFLANLVVAIGLASPAAAFAAKADKPIPVMPLSVAASVPSGFADFCVRHPRDCLVDAATADDTQVQDMKTWAAKTLWAGLLNTRRDYEQAPGSTERFSFRASLAGMGEAAGAVEQDAAEKDTAPGAVADVAMLRRVNRQINRSIISASDRDVYGREDFWASPEDRGNRGDCEDYVLAKRAALLAAGVAPSALSIALVETFRGELHAVLLVTTARGEVVLDNMSSSVKAWTKAPYRWRVRQVAGAAEHWVTVASAAP
jgi:predicted transglutaminase-like cysteine proteinase